MMDVKGIACTGETTDTLSFKSAVPLSSSKLFTTFQLIGLTVWLQLLSMKKL